jgi:hypothetical protein
MGLRAVRIQGADSTANNASGNNWAQAQQVAAGPAYLYKLVVFVPTAIGAIRTIWIFDLAAGAAGSTNPIAVLNCPAGYTTTLDFGAGGKFFQNGIYLAVSTTEPAAANSTVTAAAANAALISTDWALKNN